MHAGAPRIVLDTNVLLDFWIFDDPGARPLREALAAGRVTALRCAATDLELDHVLARERFGLESDARAALLECWRASSRQISTVAPAPIVCADPADQKFLDLAFSAQARALATKDRALLATARRAKVRGLLVGPPALIASALLQDHVP